jgi:hypothetical protein
MLPQSCSYRMVTVSHPTNCTSDRRLKNHYALLYTRVKVKFILRPTVSRPVCSGIRQPSGTRYQCSFSEWKLSSDICGSFLERGPLSDERTGLQFTRASATELFQRFQSGVPIPQKLRPYVTVSFETGFSFCRLTTRRAMVEVFQPASTGGLYTHLHCSANNTSARTAQKTRLQKLLLLRV